MRGGIVERRVSLAAPREEVWAALTERDRLGEWFGAEVLECDIRHGGRLAFRDADGTVRRALVETVDEPSLLVFRWLAIEQRSDGATMPAPASTVELRVAETAGGSELTVIESPRMLSRL